MSVRALLIYPELPPTYWSMKYSLPFIGKKASIPPLGLLTVAAMLPADFEVKLVDMNVERLDETSVAWADIVFTSSMLVQKGSHERVIRQCRGAGKKIVAGGPYPTSCHESIAGVDHFVLNEAEVTLPLFLLDLARGKPARVYRDQARPDLALTPPPRLDIVRQKEYSTMAIQYSRGCPFSCEFCDIIELFGRRPRTKTPAQVLTELTNLYDWGWRGSVFVVDDNFIGNVKEVKTMLPLVAAWQKERSFPFRLFTEATINLAADDELMNLMVGAGFNMVFLGLETPDRCTLEASGKKQNLKSDMLTSVRRIQAAGMEVSAGFVLGFDTDPEDIFDRQVRFIQDSGIPAAMVSLLTALPNTQLHRRLEREGRLCGESGGGNNTHDLALNFAPKMDSRVLIEGYKRLLAEIYAPDRYFHRCLDLLKHMTTHPSSSRRVTLTELRAFVFSLVRQTFSSYSWAYWKFILRAALAKPRMLAESVTMAVKGHHFFQMTRNVLETDMLKTALDSLANELQARVMEASPGRARSRAERLVAWRDRVLSRARSRYRRLEPEFRVHAQQALARFRAATDESIARIGAREDEMRQDGYPNDRRSSG
ncbi:MAG: B12-binding domain-containing radical SAM protein [Thermoanaerobaculia bacterium]|nr:B12-binding domain-containing radical SAM protein [Thermoanaerobaculia bacterium]